MKTFRSMTTAALSLLAMLAATQAYAQFPRTVLIEEFTSVTCGPCVAATKVLNEVLAEKGPRVISLRYHKNIPLPGDPWYNASKTDVDPRYALYTPVGLPHARVSGASVPPTSKADVVTEVNTALESEAPIKIEATQVRQEGNTVNVTVEVTGGGDGLGSGYKLYVGVIESHIQIDDQQVKNFQDNLAGYNNEKEFFDVFRAFANGSGGEELTLNPNQKKTLHYSYSIGSDWQPEQLSVVVFVQDEFSLDVVQSVASAKLTAGVREAEPMVGYSLGDVAPNPTTADAHIDFTLGTAENVTLLLYTTQGELARKISLGKMEEGAHRADIDLNDLTSGLYTLTLQAGEYRASQKLTVLK